jgi:hypothetical protein
VGVGRWRLVARAGRIWSSARQSKASSCVSFLITLCGLVAHRSSWESCPTRGRYRRLHVVFLSRSTGLLGFPLPKWHQQVQSAISSSLSALTVPAHSVSTSSVVSTPDFTHCTVSPAHGTPVNACSGSCPWPLRCTRRR